MKRNYYSLSSLTSIVLCNKTTDISLNCLVGRHHTHPCASSIELQARDCFLSPSCPLYTPNAKTLNKELGLLQITKARMTSLIKSKYMVFLFILCLLTKTPILHIPWKQSSLTLLELALPVCTYLPHDVKCNIYSVNQSTTTLLVCTYLPHNASSALNFHTMLSLTLIVLTIFSQLYECVLLFHTIFHTCVSCSSYNVYFSSTLFHDPL